MKTNSAVTLILDQQSILIISRALATYIQTSVKDGASPVKELELLHEILHYQEVE